MKLNNFLQPSDAPVSQNQGAVSLYNFDAGHERNSVDLTKIKNFSFSQGYGGTIVLGGTANGNGLMQVKNSLGSTVVTADNAGITITDGKLTFINSTGGTVLDGSGIVSSVSFTSDELVDLTQHTTTSTSATDVPGASMTPFVTTRTTRGLVTLGAFAYNNAFANPTGYNLQLLCNDSVNGNIFSYPTSGAWNIVDIDFGAQNWTTDVEPIWSSISTMVDFSAGTHTLSLQFNANTGGTAKLNAYILSYILLGS